jgi:hypothetical protein
VEGCGLDLSQNRSQWQVLVETVKNVRVPQKGGVASWGGVRLSPLGTSATVWPIVPAADDS